MRASDYAAFDGLGLAELIRRKEVSGQEVSGAAAEALERLNRQLNFLVARIDPGAAAPDAPCPAAPFAGVPFLVKDIGAAVAGVPQEMGCALARGLVPPSDSELVRRFRRAGLLLMGRSSTPELGASFTTEPRILGPTRNPYDRERSPGGSRGGAAAAVAAGAVPIAHGGDSGGSIRVPAHCCGVFGMKPSRGRNPVGPQFGEVNSGLTVAHVLTRTVRDSAAILDATAGADAGCRYTAPVPAQSFLESSLQTPRPLRMGLALTSPLTFSVSAEILDATVAAAKLCEKLGHNVEEVELPFDAETFVAMLETIWCANVHHSLRRLAALTGRTPGPDNLESSTRAMMERGGQISADALLSALDDVNRFTRGIATAFGRLDVLITPCLSDVAPPLGTLKGNAPDLKLTDYLRELLALAAFTAQYNMTGQPAMSVPLHQASGGLPIGTQFVGGYGDEATLFSLAGQLERAMPWTGRHPAVSVFA